MKDFEKYSKHLKNFKIKKHSQQIYNISFLKMNSQLKMFILTSMDGQTICSEVEQFLYKTDCILLKSIMASWIIIFNQFYLFNFINQQDNLSVVFLNSVGMNLPLDL